MSLIKKLYLDLNYIVSNVDYLSERVIFIIINVDVVTFNAQCINRFRDIVVLRLNSNRARNSNMMKKNSSKCFHHYNETFVSFYILNLKIDMLIMLFRNIRSFVMCNDIKARITRIDESCIKVEIISSKFKDTFILISCISLNFKDDDVNKERKKTMLCQFTRCQYLIRSTFVMIINKSQR